jgi:small GTP-binding protein
MGNKQEKGGKDEKKTPKGKGEKKQDTPAKANKGSTTERDHVFKILTIGDQGVGKTSLVVRFVKDHFVEAETIKNPLEADHLEKTITVDSKKCHLMIYDTQGQEGFRTITSSYYRGAHMVIICYDLTYKKSFENLNTWIQEVERYAHEKALKAIVALKSDLKDRQVSEKDGREFAENAGLAFIETSASTGANVNEAFESAASLILEAVQNGQLALDDSEDD